MADTKETRKVFSGLVVRRRRVCFNEHAFTTYEVQQDLYEILLPHLETENMTGYQKGHLRRQLKEKT